MSVVDHPSHGDSLCGPDAAPEGRGRLAGGVSHRLGQAKILSPGRGAAHRSGSNAAYNLHRDRDEHARIKSVECRPSGAISFSTSTGGSRHRLISVDPPGR